MEDRYNETKQIKEKQDIKRKQEEINYIMMKITVQNNKLTEIREAHYLVGFLYVSIYPFSYIIFLFFLFNL